MDRLEDIIQQAKSLGEEHEFSPGFTERTLARMAEIRPFAPSAPVVRGISGERAQEAYPQRSAFAELAIAAMVMVSVGLICLFLATDITRSKGDGDMRSPDSPLRQGTSDHSDDALPVSGEDAGEDKIEAEDEEEQALEPEGHYAADPSFIQKDARKPTEERESTEE